IREANQAFLSLLGYTREELIGQYGVDLFLAPGSRAQVLASIRSAGTGGTSEIVLITKTGERRLVESSSEAIIYQGRPMRVVTMQDLTARRTVEAALHESDERLRSAMNAARMGSWDWLIEQDEISWSPQMFGVFGVPEASFDRKFSSYLALVHPDDRERAQHDVEACLRGESEELAFEHRVQGSDGVLRWVEHRGRALRDATGKAIRMTGTSTD